jgi:hypothetical protein
MLSREAIETQTTKSNHTRIVIEVIDYLPRMNCQPETSRIFHQSQKQSPRCGKNDGIFFPARPFVEMRAASLLIAAKNQKSGVNADQLR